MRVTWAKRQKILQKDEFWGYLQMWENEGEI